MYRGSSSNISKQTERTTICLHDEVYTNNQLIHALKELVKNNVTDIELFKIVDDLKYL